MKEAGEVKAAGTRQKTHRTGVFVRESAVRRHLGKPDKCYDICYKTRAGKLKWEKIGWQSEGYTPQMAGHIRAERIRAMRHGEELPGEKKELPFSEAWEKFYEWAQVNRRSFGDDKVRYEKHLKDALGHLALSEISPFHFERIKSGLTKQKLSPQTIKHVLGLAREVINKAIAWGDFHGENPTRGIKFPSTRHTNRLRYLSRSEAHLLLQRVQMYSQRLYEICLVGLHTGMRAGEIWNLRWADVDVKDRTIHILGPDYSRGPKGDLARKAYMTDELAVVFAEGGRPDEHVFTDRGGKKIKSVSGSFFKAVEDLGLNAGVRDRRHKLVFHSLRHTFGSWLAISGASLQTIKELMGHGKIEQTERYAHLCPDQKRNAAMALQAMLSTPEGTAIGEIAEGAGQTVERGEAEGPV